MPILMGRASVMFILIRCLLSRWVTAPESLVPCCYRLLDSSVTNRVVRQWRPSTNRAAVPWTYPVRLFRLGLMNIMVLVFTKLPPALFTSTMLVLNTVVVLLRSTLSVVVVPVKWVLLMRTPTFS